MEKKHKEYYEKEKIKQECALLEKENKHYNRTKNLEFFKSIGITAIIAIVVTFSGNNISRTLKEKEIELSKIENESSYKLDLARFLTENREIIFSNDIIKQNQIMVLMTVIFEDTTTLKKTFLAISKTKDMDTVSIGVWLEGIKIINKISELKEFAKVNISYYTSNDNDKQISQYLKNQGLNIIRKESTNKYEYTNTMWVTKDVDIKLIKLIAEVLIQQGIGLRQIVFFKEKKQNLIQIGGLEKSEKFQKITIEDIKNSNDFIRSEY